jgi:hypothetical protein
MVPGLSSALAPNGTGETTFARDYLPAIAGLLTSLRGTRVSRDVARTILNCHRRAI